MLRKSGESSSDFQNGLKLSDLLDLFPSFDVHYPHMQEKIC